LECIIDGILGCIYIWECTWGVSEGVSGDVSRGVAQVLSEGVSGVHLGVYIKSSSSRSFYNTMPHNKQFLKIIFNCSLKWHFSSYYLVHIT